MGIACKIIRNEDNSVQFVEAPNGNRSALFEDIKKLGLEDKEAVDTWVVSTTPSFREQVIIPKINAHKIRIFNKLRNITPKNNELTLIINGDEVSVNINELQHELVETTKGITLISSTEGIDIGKVRLEPFKDGYIIKESLLNEIQIYKEGKIDTIQNNGIGTEMYKQIVTRLVTEGIPVYSSNVSSAQADGIWQKFKNVGIVEIQDVEKGRQYVINPMPSSLDNNGEPSLKDLMSFISSINNENVDTLEDIRELEIRESLLGTNFNSSEDLLREWDNVFFPNGVFEVSRKALSGTNMYSESEKQNILNNPELQTSIMETYFQLKNSPIIENDLFVDDTFLTIESTEVNVIGKYKTANPFITEKEALEVLSGSQNREEFETNLMDSELDYLKQVYFDKIGTDEDLFLKFRGYTPLVEKEIIGEELVDKIDNSVEELLSETLTDPSSIDIVESLVYLSQISPTVWINNSQEIKTLLKDFSSKSIDIGLDLIGLENHYDVKDMQQFTELFNNIDTFINNQNAETFKILSDNYIEFFNITEEVSIQNVKNVTGRSIYLNTQKSAFELFSKYGLLPTGRNVYRTVNKDRSIDEVYELIYQNIIVNPFVVPFEFYENFAVGKDGVLNRSKINNIDNKTEVLQNLKSFVRNKIGDIDSKGQIRDTDMLEKMYLYSSYFNTELNNVETISSTEQEAYLIEQDIPNIEYLTTDFISDFNKQYLKEKIKNSEMFKDFYSNFKITDKGIKLINTDPLTMDRVNIELKNMPNLKNHLLLQKDSIISESLEGDNFILEDDTFLRNYYSNFPRAIEKFRDDYSIIDRETLIAKTADNFIRTDEGIFEMVDSYGDYSVFKKLQENVSNYKIYDKTITKSVNEIDLSGYGLFENNSGTEKTVNNIYSKEQETNIDNEIDNC